MQRENAAGTPVDHLVTANEPHFHRDERGFLVKCYHGSIDLLTNWQFWAGLTMGFPIEHFLWEKVWPLNLITQWIETF